jgi:hypothetical protein
MASSTGRTSVSAAELIEALTDLHEHTEEGLYVRLFDGDHDNALVGAWFAEWLDDFLIYGGRCPECGYAIEPGHGPRTCYAPWEQA